MYQAVTATPQGASAVAAQAAAANALTRFGSVLGSALPHLTPRDVTYIGAASGLDPRDMVTFAPGRRASREVTQEWVLACATALGQPAPTGKALSDLVDAVNRDALASLTPTPGAFAHPPQPVVTNPAEATISAVAGPPRLTDTASAHARASAYAHQWVTVYETLMSGNAFLGAASTSPGTRSRTS